MQAQLEQPESDQTEPQPSYPDDPIRPLQAAKLLGVHVSQVYRWMDSGALPFWVLPGRHKRVSKADVLALPRLGKARRAPTPRVQGARQQAAMNKLDAQTLSRYGLG